MRWDGDGDGADVDDDLDDARDDDDDDGDDLPFREVFSLAESARRRWIFFSVGFRHEAAAKLRNSSSFRVFTPGGNIGQRGAPDVGPGSQEASGAPWGGGAWALGGSPLAQFWAPHAILQNIGTC